jgi:predicted ATPase/DNA-binding SARP family transcriptional activator
MVRIGLLGGIAAATDDGEPLDIGPAKCRAVLAALALSAGSVVSVSLLVEQVWGAEPPRTAEKTLQSYVVRLRKGLGVDSIDRIGSAYRLTVAPDAVDVARFQRHLDVGDIGSALAEWTGTPLAGLDGHGLTPVVDGLVEQWLGAVEIDLARRVETDAQAAIGPLTELAANHPFREELWHLLMTALYRAGRQADALAAFRRARRHLVEQLGVEPGPRLRELESLVLDHDEQLYGATAGRPTGTVTFGFCEVPGSSQLWATHRKKMAAAMVRLVELVTAAVDRHGGCVFATGGESFGAAFHRADDAAAWAVELQLEVGGEPWPGGVEVALRIGLHTGETEERSRGYFGPAVNAAARIAGAGHGGQTLVSAVTSALLDRGDLRDLGTFRVDGDVVGHRVFQLGDGEHLSPRTGDGRLGNLPVRRGRLIGRAGDLVVVADALARSAVVTLVGPGGIGKTRLALAAAQAADADGRREAWLVELAAVASSRDVPRAVADTLEVAESSGRTVTQSIVAALRPRPVLLVLDNCEHVIDGAAALAGAVAEQCPGVRVLATSREALGVEDEQLVAVASLEPGPGAELFDERARAVSPTFDRHAHRVEVEEICRRLDGIPLAIELAAARARTLTPPDLVERLGDRLRLLTRGRRTGAERHRTLRATIAWSYDMLTRPQQVLFGRLSIFAGPFGPGAVRSVAVDHELDLVDVGDLLGDLVERSMLIIESGPRRRRFRLLETMREFAAEQLRDDHDAHRIAERHCRWCLDQVTRIHHLLVGPDEVDGVARLAELWPNLRAGFDWACAAGDRELAGSLVRPVTGELELRRQVEICDWAERLLVLTPPADDDQIVYWLSVATRRYMQTGDRVGFERLLNRHGGPEHAVIRYLRASFYDDGAAVGESSVEAVAWLRRRGEDHAAALMEIGGASGLLSTGRFAELDVAVSALADRYRAHGPPTLLYVALTMLGYSAFFQGKPDHAHVLFDESARITVPERTISVNEPVEARAAFRRGDRRGAFRILRSHVDGLLRTGYMDIAGNAAVEFINMMASVDRLPDAARVLSYLGTTGDFGALAVRTLVADAAGQIAAGAGPISSPARPPDQLLDTRQALEFMRVVLDELSDEHHIVH